MVEVTSVVSNSFEQVKRGNKSSFVVIKLSSDLKSFEVEQLETSNSSHDDLVSALPEVEPRYAVVKFGYHENDNEEREKLVFVSWSPDGASVQQKMLYMSCKDDLKRTFLGISVDLLTTDYDEISREMVVDKVKRL